ncbi:alpha/beta hydrolase [Kitasatospora sp. NPDC056731]|uniref:alpha/beta hydrolase n=1 Tax=Kitasatospora sp. NPDC056731 TaxID=3155422 RepID=UPI00343E7D96
MPRLDWRSCVPDFDCARATVPMDYRDPAGRTVEPAVIRHPATDPAHRIGSLFFNPGDPAWPYAGSRALADTLARGRLLTVHGYGHTALGNPSACAWDRERRYLVSGELPPPGTVCEPDHQAF